METISIQNVAMEARDMREEDSRMEGMNAIDGRAGDKTQKDWLVPRLSFSLFTIFLVFVFQVS